MQLTWSTPPAATALHAAIARFDGLPLIDGGVASGVAEAAAGCSRADLVGLAGGVVAGSSLSPGSGTTRLAALTGAVEGLGDELAHRVRPIREQWEARGPGLLRELERLTSPIGVERATVSLVLPVTGGHGVALPEGGAVLFEAMLANPHPQLPEVVRLGWLLAQLGAAASPIALAPAVLAAAEEVELATADQPTLADALQVWRLVSDRQEADEKASRLSRWWKDYMERSTPWRAALQSVPE